jgi:hypothetical protein
MHAPALARSDDLAGTAAIEKAFERPRRAENTIATRIILRRRSAEVGALHRHCRESKKIGTAGFAVALNFDK